MEDEPVEDRLSRKAWGLVGNIDVWIERLHARLLDELQKREEELDRDPTEARLWEEAWKLLGTLFTRVEHYSDAGLFPENMEKYVADDSHFLDLGLEHEIPPAMLAKVARKIAALHSEVLDVLRGGELGFEDEDW